MTHKEYLKKADKLYESIENLHNHKFEFWLENVLFTWQWWLGVSLAVIPWLLWIILRKKESTHRLLYAGFFSMAISSWFDFIGVALGLWHYNFEVLPFIPSYLPWDFALIPVTIMFVIQYKPHLNMYIKSFIFAGGSAFIGEPIFNWLKTYDPEHWKYIYSFPILMAIYLMAHSLTKKKTFDEL